MRIAHFSDLHLLSLDGVPPWRFLNKRLTGYANLRMKRGSIHRSSYVRKIAREIARQKLDHVVISGDLTNLALESEFELAREVIEKDLALSPRDVSIVPGNHDLYTRGAESKKRFSTYFADYMESDLPELAVNVGVGRFPIVKLRGPAAVIGLCSAVPRLPFVSSGALGKGQLDALTCVLAHPEVQKRTPVVAIHHPTDNPRSRLGALLRGLDDAALLWSSFKNLPQGMVLHGHLHTRVHRVLPTSNGKIHSVGATSASLHHASRAKMAGYNLYVIGEDGVVGEIEAHVLRADGVGFAAESLPRIVS